MIPKRCRSFVCSFSGWLVGWTVLLLVWKWAGPSAGFESTDQSTCRSGMYNPFCRNIRALKMCQREWWYFKSYIYKREGGRRRGGHIRNLKRQQKLVNQPTDRPVDWIWIDVFASFFYFNFPRQIRHTKYVFRRYWIEILWSDEMNEWLLDFFFFLLFSLTDCLNEWVRLWFAFSGLALN